MTISCHFLKVTKVIYESVVYFSGVKYNGSMEENTWLKRAEREEIPFHHVRKRS